MDIFMGFMVPDDDILALSFEESLEIERKLVFRYSIKLSNRVKICLITIMHYFYNRFKIQFFIQEYLCIKASDHNMCH